VVGLPGCKMTCGVPEARPGSERKVRFIGTIAIAAVLGASFDAAAGEIRRYAVITGQGRALDPKVPPLEFADDDAARYAELFGQIGDDVTVLAVLDPENQKRHGDVAARARKPDRAGMLAALSETYRRIEADRAAGKKTVLYFVLVGHGEVGPGGEGFVSLLDSAFTRGDLYREVIDRSPASITHVIVDACNSYYMVHRRGSAAGADDTGPSRASLVRDYVESEQLSRHPNVGVLLSTSSAKESHEWAGFGAGVFSHEIRSALIGGADANRDGRVDYSEVHAFVTAANLQVADPRARVEMFVAPPAMDVREPLVDLSATRFSHYLTLPEGRSSRLYLEDDRGVRYADLHMSGEAGVHVALVPRRYYYVRSADGSLEQRVELSVPGRVEIDPDYLVKIELAARGSIHEAFRDQLFAEAYGGLFHRGFAAAHGYLAPEAPPKGAWTPSGSAAKSVGIDRSLIDLKLRRINERAAKDPALAKRLARAAAQIGARIVKEDWSEAAAILRGVEADGGN
jgi:hypothetical protein